MNEDSRKLQLILKILELEKKLDVLQERMDEHIAMQSEIAQYMQPKNRIP